MLRSIYRAHIVHYPIHMYSAVRIYIYIYIMLIYKIQKGYLDIPTITYPWLPLRCCYPGNRAIPSCRHDIPAHSAHPCDQSEVVSVYFITLSNLIFITPWKQPLLFIIIKRFIRYLARCQCIMEHSGLQDKLTLQDSFSKNICTLA